MAASAIQARARVLDPVENISIKPGAVGDGRHRKAYLAAATSGAWGHDWSTCGYMTMVRSDGGVTSIKPVLCDCWACLVCGPRRVAWLKRNIGQAVMTYNLAQFWTLTIWTETCTPGESFSLAAQSWNITRTNLTRDYGRFSYIWTVEATKRGYAHLHLLSSLQIERGDLSRRWEAATGGSFVVDVQPIHSARAANYLSKYCVQQSTLRREPEWDGLRHKRLFSKSRDVVFTPYRTQSESETTWGIVQRPYWEMAARLRETARVLSERVTGVPELSVRAVQ